MDTISDVEKFTYLRIFLKEGAEAAIKGLALSEANYKEALEILIKGSEIYKSSSTATCRAIVVWLFTPFNSNKHFNNICDVK